MRPLSTIYTNITHPLTLIYSDTEEAPIDITGATAELVIRRSAFSTPVITKSAVINGASGTIMFTILPSDTQDILGERESEKFMCGAVLTLTDGSTVNLFQSNVTIQYNIVTQ